MHPRQEPCPSPDYRVWIARCGSWQPVHWQDTPPEAVALCPAEPGVYSRRAATRYVEAFNRTVLRRGRAGVWAVAVPVTIVYQGDPRPGEEMHTQRVQPGEPNA